MSPYISHIPKVTDMATHQISSGSHEEVQHLVGQDGHEGVLPVQRVDVEHEALSHQ